MLLSFINIVGDLVRWGVRNVSSGRAPAKPVTTFPAFLILCAKTLSLSGRVRIVVRSDLPQRGYLLLIYLLCAFKLLAGGNG